MCLCVVLNTFVKIYILCVKYLMFFECASKWWNVYTLCWVSENKREVLHNGNIKNASSRMISGFHRGIIETFVFLECYVASILNCELFGKICWSHLWWSSSHAWPLVVEKIAYLKTLVTTNQHCLTSQKAKISTPAYLCIYKNDIARSYPANFYCCATGFNNLLLFDLCFVLSVWLSVSYYNMYFWP